MTRKEVMLNTVWDEFGMGTCRLFVDFFNQYIPFILFQDHKPTPNISTPMMQSINAILTLDEGERERLKSILHEVYLSQAVFVQEGAMVWNKEELYLQSKVKEIHIDQEHDHCDGTYAEIVIHCAWNALLSVIVKEGEMTYPEESL